MADPQLNSVIEATYHSISLVHPQPVLCSGSLPQGFKIGGTVLGVAWKLNHIQQQEKTVSLYLCLFKQGDLSENLPNRLFVIFH